MTVMENLKQYEIDDPNFVDDLKKSDSHVAKVVKWLQGKGITARKQPIKIRDKVENMSAFSDDGDIFIDWQGGEERVEAKQRHINFTSENDFPYGTIIVDAAHNWDNANPKPRFYILTNDAVTHCCVVKGSTYDNWIRVKKWDRFKKRDRWFLECPVGCAKFYSMDSKMEIKPNENV